MGKPIIAYSIATAINSGLFDEIMVSTDDLEIADVAKAFCAEVPFLRSERNADDFTPTIDVINEVLGVYLSKFDRTFDYICCLYPTAPLTTVETLKEGLKVIKQGYKSVFPVVKYGHPIWRGMTREGLKTSLIWEEYANVRSQDLQSVYHDAGQWYWVSANELPKTLLSNQAASIEVAETEVQDIDNFIDWKLAELKYELLHETRI